MSSLSLLSRFEGAVLGAIFGDCLGAKFETMWMEKPFSTVIEHLDGVKQRVQEDQEIQKGFIKYTDDSCMTFDLGESLVLYKEFNPNHVARTFSETYFASPPQRYYGGHVVSVFNDLKKQNYEGDVFLPASKQFGGSGSYGNGSAMRVCPVPLFHHNDIPNIVKLAIDQSKLTHTNPMGINGAILQSLAIEKAMNAEKIKDPVEFCKELNKQLSKVTPYKDNLKEFDVRMKGCMKFLKSRKIIDAFDFNNQIGSDVTAQQAVPAAIFSFLYTLDEKRIPELSKFDGLVRATIFAVAVSEDCDTVGSMAAAIAGAYYGIEQIPKEWVHACEGADRALKLADDLYAINEEKSSK